jgi:hypothetical protein
MTEQSIFDNAGRIRTDLDKLEVSAERRPALDALMAAQLMTTQTEAEQKMAEKLLAAAVRARNEIAAKMPRTTFQDELRANIRQYQQDHGR